LDDSDWGYDHDFSGYNGKPCDSDEAETYAVHDGIGSAIKAAREKVEQLEREEMKK